MAAFQDGDAEASLQALDKAIALGQSPVASSKVDLPAPSAAEALLFTASKLQRVSELSRRNVDSMGRADLNVVVLRSLLAKASIFRTSGQLQKALSLLEEARTLGADVRVMQEGLLADIKTASQTAP